MPVTSRLTWWHIRSKAKLFYERQCLHLILNQMIATFARMLKSHPVTYINRRPAQDHAGPKDSLIKDHSEPNRLKPFTRTKVIFKFNIKPRYIYLKATYRRCGKKVPWLQRSWGSKINLQSFTGWVWNVFNHLFEATTTVTYLYFHT